MVYKMDFYNRMPRHVDEQNIYKTGTTTLALKCKDGVVLGSDTRVTAGYFVAHKIGKKIFMIRPYIAVTIAGVVADAQAIIDILKYNVNLYELKYGKQVSAKAAARLLSFILYRNRMFPLITELIVAGKDLDGFSIYKLDPFGSLIKDNYTVSGSGSPIAMGVIESEYSEDLSVNEGISLAAKALLSAMKRDVASGDDFNIAVIDEKGYRELSREEKDTYLKGISDIRT